MHQYDRAMLGEFANTLPELEIEDGVWAHGHEFARRVRA